MQCMDLRLKDLRRSRIGFYFECPWFVNVVVKLFGLIDRRVFLKLALWSSRPARGEPKRWLLRGPGNLAAARGGPS